MAAKQNRIFGLGERVKIAKKSRVVDTERAQEGLPPDDRPAIDQDVTGIEGEVTGIPYESREKGEVCVPIKLENEAVISVPESRLERTTRTPRKERPERADDTPESPHGGFAPTKDDIEFWRGYFNRRGKKKKG